jgi:carbon monoxide dehydrogenase subunit G
MAAEQLETIVPADPEKVWAVLGDFGGIDAFFPGIQSWTWAGTRSRSA